MTRTKSELPTITVTASQMLGPVTSLPPAPPHTYLELPELPTSVANYRIRIPGYRLNKAGELIPDVRRPSVSQRLCRAGSKRVRPARSGCGYRGYRVAAPSPTTTNGAQ
jgi:hypothetical protein